MINRLLAAAALGGLLTAACVTVPAAGGALAAGVQDCIAIEAAKARLACYDLAAGRSGAALTSPGRWEISEKMNPLDDTRTVVALLRPAEGNASILIARCQSNSTEVYIDWDEYVGDDSSSPYREMKRVTLRLDDAKAATEEWNVSTDKKATFAPKAIPLLKQMASAKRLVVQVTPYGENPRTVIYDLRGTAEALVPLAKTCNWSF